MLTTASVTTDFAGGAKVGDWVEAHVDVHKVGGRLAFSLVQRVLAELGRPLRGEVFRRVRGGGDDTGRLAVGANDLLPGLLGAGDVGRVFREPVQVHEAAARRWGSRGWNRYSKNESFL